MDFMDVKAFIEEKGIPEMSYEILVDFLKDPNYVNVLKMRPKP